MNSQFIKHYNVVGCRPGKDFQRLDTFYITTPFHKTVIQYLFMHQPPLIGDHSYNGLLIQ